jgi:sugar lactone lactonase YvrE
MSLYFNTLAGTAGSAGSTDATGSAARFSGPYDVSTDLSGNVFVADTNNHTIRKVTSAGVVTTIAGTAGASGSTDATGSAARFKNPYGISVDAAGNIFVSDTNNYTIRKVTSAGVVTTLAGSPGSTGSTDATGSAARFGTPYGLSVDTAGNVFVADRGNHTIRKVTSAGVVTTLAGQAGSAGSTDGTGSAARFNQPNGISVDTAGNVYVGDIYNHTIRKVTSAGVVSTLAGLAGSAGSTDGTGSAARLNHPHGVSVDTAGNVFVCDLYNHTIRKVTSAGVVTTEAGLAGSAGSNNGLGTAARFYYPHGVAVDATGNVFVADTFNATIRVSVTSAPATVTLSNLSKTYTGSAQAPTTTVSPSGLAIELTYTGTAASLSAPVTAGSYVVTASIVDNFYYGSASGVITISKASQTITFASVPSKFVGSGPFTVAPSSTSNLTVALSSSNTAVATVSGFSISPIGAGTTTISATQAGDVNYLAAATVTQVLTATTAPIAQTIAFAALSPRRVASLKDVYSAASVIASSTSLSFADATSVAQANARSNGSFALVATASSGLPVTFTSTVTGVASIVGNICTPVTPGVTNIVAAQAGNNAYTAATSVTQSLVIVEKQFAWLDLRWELTDLQIDARTRVVTSAKGNGAVLTIRQGDAHDIAVFFTDPAGAAILMAPSALKLCIREKTNRRPVILETTAFTPADFGGFDPYYQISFTADNDSLQRFVAFNGVADNSDAIPAIGEVEWTYGGKVYSSKPFTVNIVPEIEREISDV